MLIVTLWMVSGFTGHVLTCLTFFLFGSCSLLHQLFFCNPWIHNSLIAYQRLLYMFFRLYLCIGLCVYVPTKDIMLSVVEAGCYLIMCFWTHGTAKQPAVMFSPSDHFDPLLRPYCVLSLSLFYSAHLSRSPGNDNCCWLDQCYGNKTWLHVMVTKYLSHINDTFPVYAVS